MRMHVQSHLLLVLGSQAHLSALFKVAATAFRAKTAKPVTEILHVLEVVNLHPMSLFKYLRQELSEDEPAHPICAKLMLAHVPATARSPQRPSIILLPGTFQKNEHSYLVLISLRNACSPRIRRGEFILGVSFTRRTYLRLGSCVRALRRTSSCVHEGKIG